MKKSLLLLVLIILLGGLMRFYLLGKNPPALNTDEAAIGYNAYSILKTGRDEYGQFLPLAFRSFDDYKPPLYIYLTVPAVAILGLTEQAVRIPSALMGILAIVFTYLLARKLFRREKVALISALLLSVSPWHLLFTRSAYEVGSLALFTSAGVYFFLKGKDNIIYYFLSAGFFLLSPYLYQSAKVFSPLIIIALLLFFLWPQSVSRLKKILLAGLFFLCLLPGILSLISPEGSVRFRGLSIFADPRPAQVQVTDRQTDWLRNDNRSALIFHHPELASLTPFLAGYLAHFRPDFLFLDVEDTRLPYIPEQGLLYLIEMPFLIIGFYFLWRKCPKSVALLLTLWFLIAPLPSAAVVGAPNSVRSAAILPVIYLITAIGISYSLPTLRRNFQRLAVGVLAIVFIYSVAYFEHELFVHAPLAHSQTWYYSYKEAVMAAAKLAPNYDHIVVSNSLDEPYIFFLFYLRKDPAAYQLNGGTISGGFRADQNKFDKYSFVFLDWGKLKKEPNVLAIGAPKDFAADYRLIRKFSYLDDSPSIYFVSTK